jgi:hypothetical protein
MADAGSARVERLDDGTDCVVFTKTDSMQNVTRLFLDDQARVRLREMRNYKSGKIHRFEIKFDDGTQGWGLKSWVLDIQNDDTPPLDRTASLIDDVTVNNALVNSTFALTLPPGTLVYDRRIENEEMAHFIVSRNGKWDPISMDDLMANKPPRAVANPWMTRWIASGLACIVIVFTVLFFRKGIGK